MDYLITRCHPNECVHRSVGTHRKKVSTGATTVWRGGNCDENILIMLTVKRSVTLLSIITFFFLKKIPETLKVSGGKMGKFQVSRKDKKG